MSKKLIAETRIRYNDRSYEPGNSFIVDSDEEADELVRDRKAKHYPIPRIERTPVNLITRKIKNPFNKGFGEIGVYIRETNYYAGGRIYFKNLIKALMELGEDITIHTNKAHDPNTFGYNDIGYIISDDIPEYDSYFVIIGEINKSIPAAYRYNRPFYMAVFDALPNLIRYGVDEYNYKEEQKLYYGNHENILKNPNCTIITISDFARKGIKKWIGKSSKIIYPAIDYDLVRSVQKQPKEDWIVFVSRVDKIKQPFKLLDIAERLRGILDLHIVTNFINGVFEKDFRDRARQLGVTIHFGVDDEEKYRIIKKSRVMINTAAEEGFGIYITEAQACGIPFVGFDIPTSREIKDIQSKGIYLAKDMDEFIELILRSGKEGDYIPVCKFGLDAFKENIKEALL